MFRIEQELLDLPIGTVLERKLDGRHYTKLNYVDPNRRDIPWLSPEGLVVFYPFPGGPRDRLKKFARIVKKPRK
jgi:hypothetical protein